jgi:hypothetical protein
LTAGLNDAAVDEVAQGSCARRNARNAEADMAEVADTHRDGSYEAAKTYRKVKQGGCGATEHVSFASSPDERTVEHRLLIKLHE